MDYFRPVAQTDPIRPAEAVPLAGGWAWFTHAEYLTRSGSRGLVSAQSLPAAMARRLSAPRADIAGLKMDRPRLMAILNVTPDSFSDGGRFDRPETAIAHAKDMAASGADILDIGGESTRPGAADVRAEEEIARTAPVIRSLRASGVQVPISIDTRKAEVVRAALREGARFVNDVAALSYDPEIAHEVAAARIPICLMHAQGTPATMQADPRYADVLLDVYDFLEARIAQAEAAGIPRARIVVDPGIGFGKTVAHNLALLRGLSLFHMTGCVILLGASRKRFIGAVGGGEAANVADQRGPGTLAVTHIGLQQGVQIHRLHDMVAAKQALRLWQAVTLGEEA
jgi:dihydropteroate synthase